MAVILANDLDGFTVVVNDTTFIVPEDVYILDNNGVAFDFAATTNNGLLVRGTIASDNDDAIRANGSTNLDIVIDHTGVVMGDNDGIELANTTFSEVTNFGKIVGRDNEGVEFDGNNNTLNNYGEIVAEETGVETDGDFHRIFNYGQITARDDEAVNMDGNGNRLVNTGVLMSHTDAAVRLQGNDNVFFNSGQVLAHGQPGVELVGAAGDVGSLFNSGTISGQDGDGNAIVGSEADEIVINEGTINGNVVLGGGNDIFNGTGGTVFGSVLGGAGDDLYIVDDPTLTLVENAGEGIDTVNANTNWTLGANFENLNLVGGGDHSGVGNNLDNVINGNIGDNTISGGAGNDLLRGGDGNDKLFGDSGDDRLVGGPGDDFLHGGGGADNLLGGAGDDVLRGGAGDDRLAGGPGSDSMFGGSGDDRLLGGSGQDALVGGLGQDVLIGGPDADRFVYNSVQESPVGAANRDRINDFSSAQGDRIDLSGIDADVNTGGDDSFTFIGTSGFSGSAGELRFVNVGPNILVTGDVDGDGIADFEIFVNNTATLSASDFIL
jgi:serralysin